MRFIVAVLTCLATTVAQAQGFAIRDLSRIAGDAQATLGSGFQHRATPQRVILTCPTCKGEPMVDIQLGRQTDGTEERVRSGQTPIARFEELCRAKNPECRIVGLDIAPGVGWISRYQLASTMAGSTAIILRGGDMLTIRSIAVEPLVAQGNAEKLVRAVAPRVVGR